MNVFINEIHYDNAGTDQGEAIELVGEAGIDLTGWSLVLYNGNGGASYNTQNLSGIIADLGNGFGTVVINYPTDGVQNGAPDGIALVDNNGMVVQFLSYEGTFVATNGPAAGLTSTDISVAESSTTPVGFSLQLTGTGTAASDFTWAAAAASTFGAANTGQTFEAAPPETVDLSTYVRIGRYNLPEPNRTTAPAGSGLAQEVSAVTYNPDTDTLFVIGDEGTSVVEVSKTGRLISSMTLTAGDFDDPEGLTHVSGNQFVLVEERERQANLFTYVPDGTLSRADVQSVKLGTTVGNIGLEGISFDPETGEYILVKETSPQGIFQTGIDFGAGTATNGSPTTANSTNLFDPALAGLTDIADVYALANFQPGDDNLLVLGQEDGKIVNIDRTTGVISSSLQITADPENPLPVSGQGFEGVTMDSNGLLYITSEQGGGDSDHPQLWVYAPASFVYANAAPVEVSLSNVVNNLAENSDTTNPIKIGNIIISDDALGTNNLSLTGADAAAFEIVGTELFLKADTALDFETKPSFEVTLNVDDPSLGSSPDASTTFTLDIADTTDAPADLIISEVAPWSSGNSPGVGADWFEVTNTSGTAIDITGWRIDDDSASFANSSALSGVTSIAPGQSVVFVEGDANTINAFVSTWFGGTLPSGVAIGTYGGPGLGTGGDAVNLFDAGGALVTGVTFGASPAASPFASFDNAAGLPAVSNLSAIGVNGAFSVIDVGTNAAAVLIGSPGTTSVAPVPLTTQVAIAATDAAAAENGQNPGTFTILRTGDTTDALTVVYGFAVGAGQATSDDYTPALTGNVEIPAGASSVDITITPVNDPIPEGTETVTLVLLDEPTYDLGTNTSATVTIADNDSAIANFNLQVTEIWPGNSTGSDLTADWFEIKNIGTEAWVAGVAPDLYYDDDSQAPSEADLISGITQIDPGESVVVVVTKNAAADVATFTSVWGSVIDLTGVDIGSTPGAGLGAGGDGVSLFVGLPGTGAVPADFETYPTGSAGQSYDVDLTAFSVANQNGAVATAPNDGGQAAVGSPGNGTPLVVPTPEIFINEIRIDQTGDDNDEYFELTGPAGTSLNDLTYLVIGDGTGGSGVIESVTVLSGQAIPTDGYFLAAENTLTLGTADFTTSLNFENSDNVTHLLVQNFTGTNGQDLDTNDDGVLDVTPWDAIVDAVALIETPGSEDLVYSATQVGPDGSFVPGHVYRLPNGTGDFQIGAFDLAGGNDTPGTANSANNDFDLQITEIWPGNAPGSNLSADWFEITNFGLEAWVGGADLALYYDDDSQAPLEADQILGLNQIDPGESVIVVVGNEAAVQVFRDLWSPVVDLTNVEVGYTQGAGLGQGGDGVTLFAGQPVAGDTPIDFEAYPDANATGGQSYDIILDAFSVAGQNQAVATAQVNDAGQSAVGSPGDIPELIVEPTLISAIQGSGTASPLVGQTVTVEAVVTGDFQDGAAGTDGDFNGFFLQEENSDSDGNALTSEGIFVFEGTNNVIANVQTGDKVRVTGIVSEFFGETQITATGIEVIASGNSGLVTPATIAFPVASTFTNSDGALIADLEAYEGMLVTIPQELTVADLFTLGRFGDIGLYADGRLETYTQNNAPGVAGFQAYQDLAVRNTVILDDGSTIQNPATIPFEVASAPGDVVGQLDANDQLRTGDTITDLTGVVRFSRGSGGSGDEIYRINPTATPVFENTNPRPTEAPDVGGDIKVASFNVLNFFTTLGNEGLGSGPNNLEPRGANNATEFDRQLQKLLAAFTEIEADIFGLIELENEFGDQNGDGEFAIGFLVDALNNTITGANYQYVDPGQGFIDTGDAISVGLIYNANTVNIAAGTNVAILTDALLPGLGVDPGVPVFDGDGTSRAPLAVTFEEVATGEDFTVVVNHFKSKGSPGPAPGDADQGDGVGAANQTRLNAAIALDAWLDTAPTGSTDDDVLIIGDLNAYAMEDPIQYLLGQGYEDQVKRFLETGDFEYSFGFPLDLVTSPQVQAFGALDYALATGSLADQITGAAEWHINADEASVFDYNTEFKPQAQIDGLFGANPFRSSDHDPVIIGLNLFSGPTITNQTTTQGTPINDLVEDNTLGELIKNFGEGDANGYLNLGAQLKNNSALANHLFNDQVDAAFQARTGVGGINGIRIQAIGDNTNLGNLLALDGDTTSTTSYAISVQDDQSFFANRIAGWDVGDFTDAFTNPLEFDDGTAAVNEDGTTLALFSNLTSLVGTRFNDLFSGGTENDNFSADSGDDVVLGNAGDDTLLGGNGADNLSGGVGSDQIRGGRGDDLLRGGDNFASFGPAAGDGTSDVFVFEAIGNGNDRVTDFELSSNGFQGDVLAFRIDSAGKVELGDELDANGNLIITIRNFIGQTGSVKLDGIDTADEYNAIAQQITALGNPSKFSTNFDIIGVS